MSVEILTVEAAKSANLDVIENRKGTQALHEMVVALRANRRSGTANTKTKAEVNLSGRKPWRQKGTGRARAGYFASPVWRGGGVVFGPKPRDYSKKVPKSVRKLALRKALSSRIVDGDVLVIEQFAVAEPKTKSFIAGVKAIIDAKKILIISRAFDATTFLAGRNVANVQLITSAEVNPEQLLNYTKIVVTREALADLATRSAK